MKHALLLIVCLLAITLLAGTATAPPTPAALGRFVTAGGGGTVTNGSTIILSSTVGEAVANDLSTTGTLRMGAGYWEDLTPDYPMFLPLVRK